MSKVLYVWKGKYPWDIRAEKICNSFLKNGYEVYLLSRWFEGQAKQENYKGINIIRTGRNSQINQPLSFNPIWKKAIKLSIDEIKPDLIMPRDIMLAEACGKQGRKKNIPVIMDMAENYPAAMKGWKKYKKTLLKRIAVHYLNLPEIVEKRAVRFMDGIITVCDEQNFRLNKQYNFDLKKMCVVHNTPEKELFPVVCRQSSVVSHQSSVVSRQSATESNKKEKIVFGHHGYTSDEKSIVKFLYGFELAAKVNDRICLHVAGSGESLDDMKKITDKFSSKERIIFTGEYQYNELPEIISGWDIGILPYQLNDFNNYTIHNKIFDFFAMGKPVFCSETKPFKRIISETEAGITVNCEDEYDIKEAILKFAEMDLSEMAMNGRKAFEDKYNWNADSENMMKFIERFI